MKQKVCMVVSSVLFLLAAVVSCSASLFWFYQPKVPKSLAKSKF